MADSLALYRQLSAGAEADTSFGRALARGLRILRDATRGLAYLHAPRPADGKPLVAGGDKDAQQIAELRRSLGRTEPVSAPLFSKTVMPTGASGGATTAGRP